MGINIGLNLILPLQLADQASYLAPFLVAIIGGYMLYRTVKQRPDAA